MTCWLPWLSFVDEMITETGTLWNHRWRWRYIAFCRKKIKLFWHFLGIEYDLVIRWRLLAAFLNLGATLMAHNWQKWKSRFLTCPCNKIDRGKEVALSISNYALKITIFGENVIFGAISCTFDILLIIAQLKFNLKLILHTCDKCNCDYLPHITFCFYLIDFQLNIDLPSHFCVFYSKFTLRYSKIGFSRKCF